MPHVHGAEPPVRNSFDSAKFPALKSGFDLGEFPKLKSGFDSGEFSPVGGKFTPDRREPQRRQEPEQEGRPGKTQGTIARIAAAIIPGLKPKRKTGDDAVATRPAKLLKRPTRGR
ncbi:hypothetical protein OG215_39300 (plasmid) [Streptomyces globisporus]|uniref:hypothetical protein n=1 Tax=Streptomyces globisporus TaxID=1908 RepID=UPI00386532E1|nr:hypothetical protein OG215_39300 [Streptomyces globisporus]